jgi:hypothetical protein
MNSTPRLRLVHSGPGSTQGPQHTAPRQAPLILVSAQASPADSIPIGPGRTVPRLNLLATTVTYTALAASLTVETVRRLTAPWR